MADKTIPVGGDTAFQHLFKDQTGGVYAPAVYVVTGTGNFKDVPLDGDPSFRVRYAEVSAGLYALCVYRIPDLGIN